MRTSLLMIITTAVFAVTHFLWGACNRLADKFHFSAFDLQLRLIEAIHNDKGDNILWVRIFHNKLTGTLLDIFRHYIHFWDIYVLMSVLSILGIFGLVYGVWHFFTYQRNNKTLWGLFLLMLLTPLIEILVKIEIPLNLRLLVIYWPHYAFALLGVVWFVSKGRSGKRLLFVVIITMVSLMWMFLFNMNNSSICLS